MTQAPPMRPSSATSVFAPGPEAMRAARTPPEPAPMTKKSTSNAIVQPPCPRPGTKRAWLEIDALLLHRGARALKDVRRQLFAPGSGEVGKVLNKDRGDLFIFLARGTIKESRDLGDLLLGHLRGEHALRLDVGLPGGLIEFRLNGLQSRSQRISDLRPRPGDVCFELLHHAGNDDRDRLLEANRIEDPIGGRDGNRRRRRGRGGGRGGGGPGGWGV